MSATDDVILNGHPTATTSIQGDGTQRARDAMLAGQYSPLGQALFNMYVPPPYTATPAPSTLDLQGTVPAQGAGVMLTWNPFADPLGIAYYQVYRDGKALSNGTTSWYTPSALATFTDVGVSSGMKHSYSIQAFDLGGGTSSVTSSVDVTVP